MKFTKKDLIYLFGFFIIIFYFKSTTEKMSNTDLKNLIAEQYIIDVDAIRNLSKLANDLTVNNKLVIPGGLEIKGNLKVDGNVGIRRDPHPNVGLIVNGTGLAQGVETQGAGVYADKSLRVQGNTRLNGNVGVKREAHPNVGLIVDAAGLLQGVETQGAGVYADKKLHVNGPSHVSGTLHVSGTTRFDGNVGVKRDPHPKVGFIVNAAGLTVGVETQGAGVYADKGLHVNGTTRLDGNVGVRRDPHSNVGLYVNGDGMTVGMETNTNIHTRDLMATRHIGARNEIASTAGVYAKCRSVNDSGYGSSCSKSMK